MVNGQCFICPSLWCPTVHYSDLSFTHIFMNQWVTAAMRDNSLYHLSHNIMFGKKMLSFHSTKFTSVIPSPDWLPQMPVENVNRWWSSFWRYQQFVSHASVSSHSCWGCFFVILCIILNVHSMLVSAQSAHAWSVVPHFLCLWQTEGGKEAHAKLINVSRSLPSYGSLLVAMATLALTIV